MGNLLRGHLLGVSQKEGWETQNYSSVQSGSDWNIRPSLSTLVCEFDDAEHTVPAMYHLTPGNSYVPDRNEEYKVLGQAHWSLYWLDRIYPKLDSHDLDTLTVLGVLCVQETSKVSTVVDDEIQVIHIRATEAQCLKPEAIKKYQDQARSVAQGWVEAFREHGC